MSGLATLSRNARHMAATLAYELAVEAVAQQRGVPVDTVRHAASAQCRHNRDRGNGRYRPADSTSLRREVLYVAAVVLEAPKRRLAALLGVTPTATRIACSAVEDARAADRDVDRRLDEIELQLMPMGGAL